QAEPAQRLGLVGDLDGRVAGRVTAGQKVQAQVVQAKTRAEAPVRTLGTYYPGEVQGFTERIAAVETVADVNQRLQQIQALEPEAGRRVTEGQEALRQVAQAKRDAESSLREIPNYYPAEVPGLRGQISTAETAVDVGLRLEQMQGVRDAAVKRLKEGKEA